MAIDNPLQITITPPERSLSPYQQRLAGNAPDMVNEEFFGKNGLNFKSVLDSINPLQQLPVISTAYREISGDTISTGSRLAGGALLGGPIGFALAVVNEIVSGATGKDIGANLYAAVTGYKDTEKLTG